VGHHRFELTQPIVGILAKATAERKAIAANFMKKSVLPRKLFVNRGLHGSDRCQVFERVRPSWHMSRWQDGYIFVSFVCAPLALG
jgi:hypothetical protein